MSERLYVFDGIGTAEVLAKIRERNMPQGRVVTDGVEISSAEHQKEKERQERQRTSMIAHHARNRAKSGGA